MATEREPQGFFAEGARFLGGIYDAVMAGGEVQAAVRQGFRELGNAFGQMWPDQIGVVEPGSITSPLHSDLMADKAAYSHLAEMEAEAQRSPGGKTGQRETPGRNESRLPSPSEIASEPKPQPPQRDSAQPDRGQEQQGQER